VGGSILSRDLSRRYFFNTPSRLAADPDETHDLVEEKCDGGRAHALETTLCAICDPEAVDARAKADQRRMAKYGAAPKSCAAPSRFFYARARGVERGSLGDS
jgi:hypothetical protein